MNTITLEMSKADRELLEGLRASITLLATCIADAQPKAVQEDIIKKYEAYFDAKLATRGEVNVTAVDLSNVDTTIPEDPVIVPPAADPVAEETPDPLAVASPSAAPAMPVSLAEFQKAVTLAVSKGPEAKKATKEVINKYAASVSAVPEDKRAEVMAELANI